MREDDIEYTITSRQDMLLLKTKDKQGRIEVANTDIERFTGFNYTTPWDEKPRKRKRMARKRDARGEELSRWLVSSLDREWTQIGKVDLPVSILECLGQLCAELENSDNIEAVMLPLSLPWAEANMERNMKKWPATDIIKRLVTIIQESAINVCVNAYSTSR